MSCEHMKTEKAEFLFPNYVDGIAWDVYRCDICGERFAVKAEAEEYDIDDEDMD